MCEQTSPQTQQQAKQPVNLSAGSGIAIVGIWLVAAVLVIFFALLFFTDVIAGSSLEPQGKQEISIFTFAFVCIVTALPGFAAYWLTKLIIGKK